MSCTPRLAFQNRARDWRIQALGHPTHPPRPRFQAAPNCTSPPHPAPVAAASRDRAVRFAELCGSVRAPIYRAPTADITALADPSLQVNSSLARATRLLHPRLDVL